MQSRWRPNWRRTILLTVLLIVGLLLLPLAVPTTVIPPARPANPATVFLVDFGRTSALVLAITDNRMTSYVYGDWNYYALRNRGVFDALAALLWPTQGALGRKEIAGSPNPQTVRRGIGTSIEYLHRFEVERQAVERLHAALDRLYRDGLRMAIPSYGMTFVHHPQPYTYWSNSNQMTAGWMKQLGCEVRGPAVNSWWRISASVVRLSRLPERVAREAAGTATAAGETENVPAYGPHA